MASQYFSRIKTVGFSLRLNSWLQLAIIFKFLSPDIKNQRLIIYVKELCCDHIELRRISYINNIHYVYRYLHQFKYTLQICSNLAAFSLYSKMRNTTFYLAIRRYKSTISGLMLKCCENEGTEWMHSKTPDLWSTVKRGNKLRGFLCAFYPRSWVNQVVKCYYRRHF